MRLPMLMVTGIVLLAAAPVWGHHSFAAEFDATKPITLHGTVTSIEWINPHTWIHIDVKDAAGNVVNWMVEGGSPNGLLRRGFNKTSVKAGQEVYVHGFQAKDGANRMNGSDITLPDGKKLFLGSASEDKSEK